MLDGHSLHLLVSLFAILTRRTADHTRAGATRLRPLPRRPPAHITQGCLHPRARPRGGVSLPATPRLGLTPDAGACPAAARRHSLLARPPSGEPAQQRPRPHRDDASSASRTKGRDTPVPYSHAAGQPRLPTARLSHRPPDQRDCASSEPTAGLNHRSPDQRDCASSEPACPQQQRQPCAPPGGRCERQRRGFACHGSAGTSGSPLTWHPTRQRWHQRQRKPCVPPGCRASR